MSKVKTRKKMKIVGTAEYINSSTGELENMQVIKMEDRDFNFEKIWLIHILDSLEAIGNQKIKVMKALLEMKDPQNKIIATQQMIREKTGGVSRQIISTTMQMLVDANFIKKIAPSAYMINPDTIFKGGKDNRMSVLLQYQKEDEIKLEENPDIHVLTNQADQAELNLDGEKKNGG